MTATLQDALPVQPAPAEPDRTTPAERVRTAPAEPVRAAPADGPAGAVEAVHVHAPAPATDPHAAARVVLTGALGGEDTARVARLLDDASTSAGVVQVDLSAVPEIDGTVARAFLRAAWRMEGGGRRLVLASPQRQVRRVLYWHGADYLVPREHRSARRARRGRGARRAPWDT